MVAKGSSLGLKLAIERFDLAPTLVTLPSMSLIPFAPLKLGRCPALSLLPSSLYLLCRSSRSLHCISLAPARLDRYPRGFTGHVARPSRSIQRRCWFGFVAVLLQRSIMHHKPLTMHEFNNCNHGSVSRKFVAR